MLWVAVEEPASILLKFTALDKLVTCGVEQVQEKVKMNSGPTTTTNASFTGVFSLKTQDQVDQLVLSVKAIVEVFSLLFSSIFVSSFFVSFFFFVFFFFFSFVPGVLNTSFLNMLNTVFTVVSVESTFCTLQIDMI